MVRLLLKVADKRGPLDVAMISNYRDEVDVRKFGFASIDKTPDVLSWIRYVWEDRYKARLFMIGSITEQIGGDSATPMSISRAAQQFEKAVEQAVSLGAKVILYAAATKRLPMWDILKERHPDVVFTLGDNFTGLLLGRRITDGFSRFNIVPKTSRVLIIAPYGLLGSCALHFTIYAGATVVGMGNPKRKSLLEGLKKKYDIETCTSFEDVGKVDMVIACNSAPRSQLTPERVALIRKPGRKLLVIDPNEPQNMSPELLANSSGNVIRLDSGNGISRQLKHVLEPVSYKLLRLDRGVTWGCFCEAFILADNPHLHNINWLEVTPENISIMQSYLGSGKGQFDLPSPTCFNQPLLDFNLAN